jgi:hypothetical protein
MANATKSPGKGQPTPKPPKATGKTPMATGQAPPPPATETRVLPDGTIRRYANGRLVSTTPPKANGKAPASAKPPKTSAAPTGPQPGQLFHVAKLGTEDIWELAPLSAKPGAAVIVRHFTGYDVVSEQRYTAALADKLYHELINDRGFTYIDGVTHRLVDEEA